jgi:glutaminyl-tRNA synthetase
LFRVENPDGGDGSFLDKINPDSLSVIEAVVEPSLADAAKGSHWQFERTGYFVVDTGDGPLRFNRTVGLKDSWGKAEQPAPIEETLAEAPSAEPESDDGRRKRKRKARSAVQAEVFASDPELASRLARYQTSLGLSEGDATTLASDRGLSDFFESALAATEHTKSLANWTINAVQGLAKEQGIENVQFSGAQLARLVDRVEDGTISSKGGKKVFGVMADTGEEPDALIDSLGLAQITDESTIQGFVDAFIAANPGPLEQFRGGNNKLFGFFVGGVLKASGGRAAPNIVSRLLGVTLKR